jgi:hypothetical protein
MEEKNMYHFVWKSLTSAVTLVILALMPVALAAQVAQATKTTFESPSKWDIFAGYSALIPNGDICCYPAGKEFGYNPIDYGAILSITRYFNNHVGIRIEGDEHILLPESNITWTQPGDDFSGGSAGLVYRIPMSNGKLIPSFHVLAGAEQVGSIPQTDVFGFSLTAGGSLDVRTPAFNHHLSIRLYQADYQFVHANFAANQGGSYNFNPQGRLSAGVVWNAGQMAPPTPVLLGCSPSAVNIFPGDPETIAATASGLNPKMSVVYTWSGTGVTGNAESATVATAALAPGSYTVKGQVKEGKKGREGEKPWETANCSAVFTVKAYEPPTVSCSASPDAIKPGDSATITANGVSPQNRPLTYTYSATAGTVTGNGGTANYSSAGAPTGTVGITCNAADDKGQTATANTNITISAPYVAPVPKSQALCSISFAADPKRPTRVNNEAKACLDEVALTLQRDPNSKIIVVGEATADEAAAKPVHGKTVNYAAQRAVNAKNYLVSEKGADASRISVATGSTSGQTVEDYMVPAGADFNSDVSGTSPVDEIAIKPEERKPLPAAHRARQSTKGKSTPQ